MKKRILSLLLVLLMVVSLAPTAAMADKSNTDVAYAVTSGNIYFDKSTGEITDCDSGVTEAIIPSEIDGVKVTGIGNGAFYECTSLRSVVIPNSVTCIDNGAFINCYDLIDITIPNSVTSIGCKAFYSCCLLESITIPNSVTSIAAGAFFNCTGLTSIMIPDSVTIIGNNAFDLCTRLASINVTDANMAYSSDNGILFNKDKTELIRYPEGKTDASYVICSGVTNIGEFAFYNCIGLTSITIPNSVESIDHNAFSGCTGLTSINVNDANTVYSSDEGVLFNKDKTELVKYPEGKNDASYTILDGVSSIGESAFSCCDSLTNVSIPSSVTNIGRYAFFSCDSLTSVTLADGVISIGDDAFGCCSSLTGVSIAGSVTYIGDYAFSLCRNLTSINVAGANTAYSSVNGVLFNKDKTELIKYPEGKTDTSYLIPNSVTNISIAAFDMCKNLTSITIQDNVTSIGFGAFQSCENLTSVTISDSIKTIDRSAFNGCTRLADVYYTGSEEQWSAILIDEGNEILDSATIHYHYNHEHITEIVGAVEPTCTEAGYTGDEVCTICGETIKEGEVIPATGHHFKGNTCPDCGETRSTADTIRAWFQESFNNMKNFFDKIFGRN